MMKITPNCSLEWKKDYFILEILFYYYFCYFIILKRHFTIVRESTLCLNLSLLFFFFVVIYRILNYPVNKVVKLSSDLKWQILKWL